MTDRFLDLLICAALAIGPWAIAEASAGSPYEHQLLGQCFGSQAEAMKPFRLPDGTADENVVASESAFSRDSTWVIDKTSGHNYQWYLLEKSSRGHCYSLFVPFAAEVAGTRSKGVLTIKATTQPSPGTSSYQMTFRKSSKTGRFVPYKCSEIRDQDRTKAQSPRDINCLSVEEK
jgi:hypothetical protein